MPVAKSGTGLIRPDAPWNPDTTATGDNRRYPIMVSTHAAALAQIENYLGTAAFWSGNEADLQDADWASRLPAAFAAFVARARADLGQANMPVIIGGPVEIAAPGYQQLAEMQRTFDAESGHANSISGVTYLDGPSGPGWNNDGDTVHWTTPGNRVRGDFEGHWAYLIGRGRGWWS